jgi:threonyl-tRNA synthetase
VDCAKAVAAEPRKHEVRVKLDTTSDKIGARIRRAETDRVHTILLIGQREQEAGNLAVREHGKGDLGAKPRDEILAGLLNKIKTREGA